MSTYRTGIPNLDSLTDSLNSPQAPRVLGVANEIQLAAFRSPGTWQQHLESQAAEVARSQESNADLVQILAALDRLRLARAALERPRVAGTALEPDLLAALGALEGFLAIRRVEEFTAASGTPDPVQHEVSHAESHPDIPAGRIIRVLRPGAACKGKVIRRALVITSSGPAAG